MVQALCAGLKTQEGLRELPSGALVCSWDASIMAILNVRRDHIPIQQFGSITRRMQRGNNLVQMIQPARA